MNVRRTAVALVAAGAMVVGLGAAANQSESKPGPPDPEWVNEDGTIDHSKLPETFAVRGAGGKVTGYIDADALFAPPPLDPTDKPDAARALEEQQAQPEAGRVTATEEEGGRQMEVPAERPSEEQMQEHP
jgi:hypothetical protein